MAERSNEKLDKILGDINKKFGAGTAMKMKDQDVTLELVSSGSLGLDIALGGGFPRGRIIEVYGPESSGKSTLATHLVVEIQKAGGTAVYIDAEHAFDPSYAEKLGVNLDTLIFNQPDNGEQALQIASEFIESGQIDLVVIDSVAALVPKSELEGEIGDSKMGLQARMMGQGLRMIAGATSKNKCIVFFINQVREKIGVMFGNPETTSGGNALKFYASVRLDIRGTAQVKDGDEAIGKIAKVKVIKNKVAPPYKTAEFEIIFGEGISKMGEIIDKSVDAGFIKKAGSWFSYGDIKLGQGKDSVKQILFDNPELSDELEGKVRTHYGLKS